MIDGFDNEGGNWFTLEVAGLDLDEGPTRGGPLRCSQCRSALTSRCFILCVGGCERHVRTNPAGIVFELRTFAAACGCDVSGAAETAYSWFPPLAWRIANCATCHQHCGWFFSKPGCASFFALIEDCLVEEDE